MNKVIKTVLGFVFSTIVTFTVNAQQKVDSSAARDEAIVCREISENVFDCYLKNNKEQRNSNDENNSRMERKDHLYEESPSKRDRNEAPADWNRSDVIEHTNPDNNGLDIRRQEPNKPFERKNEDNIHMPGDKTEDDAMYEYDKTKQERELMNEADDATYYQKRREELGIEA